MIRSLPAPFITVTIGRLHIPQVIVEDLEVKRFDTVRTIYKCFDEITGQLVPQLHFTSCPVFKIITFTLGFFVIYTDVH